MYTIRHTLKNALVDVVARLMGIFQEFLLVRLASRLDKFMAARTYVTGLRIVLRTAYRYASRYQPLLAEHLTSEQIACLTDTIQALYSCLALLGSEPISP